MVSPPAASSAGAWRPPRAAAIAVAVVVLLALVPTLTLAAPASPVHATPFREGFSNPVDLVVTALGETWAHLAWTNPVPDPNASLSNDTVSYSRSNCSEPVRISIGGATNDYNLSGLEPRTAYCVYVTAWETETILGSTRAIARPSTSSVSFDTLALPLVTFTWSPTNPHVNQTIAFVAKAVGGAGPYAYSWNFGDGGSSNLGTPVHAFTKSGLYTISVLLVDANGFRGGVSEVLQVTCPNCGAGWSVTTWLVLLIVATGVILASTAFQMGASEPERRRRSGSRHR
jgi:hypothetical protein